MALAEVSPSGDGEVAAGAKAESARIVELLKEKRGGESLTGFAPCKPSAGAKTAICFTGANCAQQN